MATVADPIEQPTLPREPRRTAHLARMDRIFFSSMAILFLGIVLFGFAQSYYLAGLVPMPRWKHNFAGPHPLIVHVHGAVLTTWFVLLVVQTTLIARRHVRLHRRLGYAGMAVAVGVVVLGALVVCEHLARGFPPADPKISAKGGGSLTTMFDLVVFGVLVAFAYFNRNKPAAHKRLIMIGTIGILPPALARWPVLIAGHFWVGVAVTYALVGLIAVYDLISRHRVHAATIAGGIFYFALRNSWLNDALASNRGWWFNLAVQAQNFGRHLY